MVIDKAQLKAEHFFRDAHQAVFTAMLDLEMQSQQFDIVTVYERIKTHSQQTVSYEYLAEVTESAPISQNAAYYAAIVRQKYYLRRVIDACQRTSLKAFAAEGEAGEAGEAAAAQGDGGGVDDALHACHLV